MKKTLLTLSIVAVAATAAQSQTRLALYEEFTGENCGPCASTNPTFWRRLDSVGNLSKVLQITYMSPIPSAGPFYNQNRAQTDARISYYGVSSAPNGRIDGRVHIGFGHPFYFKQPQIDSASAITSPFNISVTSSWNSTYDTAIATVTITCVSAWSGSTVKLQTALVQTVDWATPPGSNGETHFRNVVRSMYPDASGTTISGTWTAGMSQTYTIKGAVPSYVSKGDSAFFAVWVQDDASKAIAQAAKSGNLPPVPNDGAIISVTTPGFTCVADGAYSAAHSIVVKNNGNNAITSATVYYKVDGSATFLSTPWTGTLAIGATTTVTMPTASLTIAGAGYHSFYDSLGNINGSVDQSNGDNTMGDFYFIESNTTVALPFSNSFETATDRNKFYATDNNSNGQTWEAYSSVGRTGGSVAYTFPSYNVPPLEKEILTMPKVAITNPSSLDFYVAYAKYDAASNDTLQVVYSTDCGTTWTTIWNQSGTDLVTGATTTGFYTPAPTEYKLKSVAIGSVPAGSIIAFRGVSDYGNNIWIDDINFRAGTPTGIEEMATASTAASVFPNPATTATTLQFSLTAASDVTITLADQLGRSTTIAHAKLSAGNHTQAIDTKNLVSGTYVVTILSNGNVTHQQLVVSK